MNLVRARPMAALTVLTSLVLSVSGCGRPAPKGPAAPPSSAPATAVVDQPSSPSAMAVADQPSTTAQMICQPEAEDEIAEALGVIPRRTPTSSWSDHLYSCRYEYPIGTMTLSVKELPDEGATAAYLAAVQHSLPGYTPIRVSGQNGITAPDGSIYLRKDFKILHVDVGQLPTRIGNPPQTRANAAFTVAAVILSCWTGA